MAFSGVRMSWLTAPKKARLAFPASSAADSLPRGQEPLAPAAADEDYQRHDRQDQQHSRHDGGGGDQRDGQPARSVLPGPPSPCSMSPVMSWLM